MIAYDTTKRKIKTRRITRKTRTKPKTKKRGRPHRAVSAPFQLLRGVTIGGVAAIACVSNGAAKRFIDCSLAKCVRKGH